MKDNRVINLYRKQFHWLVGPLIDENNNYYTLGGWKLKCLP